MWWYNGVNSVNSVNSVYSMDSVDSVDSVDSWWDNSDAGVTNEFVFNILRAIIKEKKATQCTVDGSVYVVIM